jgi:hypothetical protein
MEVCHEEEALLQIKVARSMKALKKGWSMLESVQLFE